MSAVTNPDQLSMFANFGGAEWPTLVRASELMTLPAQDDHFGNPEGMWDQKREEAMAPGSSWSAHPRSWRPMPFGPPPPDRATTPSLVESIRDEGVKTPVDVRHYPEGVGARGSTQTQMLGNGHHRVAGAHEVDPDYLVPVTHKGRLGEDVAEMDRGWVR